MMGMEYMSEDYTVLETGKLDIEMYNHHHSFVGSALVVE